MTGVDYERALARIPNWMLVLAIAGTVFEYRYGGIQCVLGFLAGAVAARLNLRLVERGVNRVMQSMTDGEKVSTGSGVRIYIEFAIFAGLAFVILRFTGFNLKAAICGFLVCPAAVVVEILYELFIWSPAKHG